MCTIGLFCLFIVQLFSPDNKDKKFTTVLVHSGIRTLLELWFKTSQFSLIIIIFSIRTLLHIILLYCSYYTVQYIHILTVLTYSSLSACQSYHSLLTILLSTSMPVFFFFTHFFPIFMRASLVTLYSLHNYCLLACQYSFSVLTLCVTYSLHILRSTSGMSVFFFCTLYIPVFMRASLITLYSLYSYL